MILALALQVQSVDCCTRVHILWQGKIIYDLAGIACDFSMASAALALSKNRLKITAPLRQLHLNAKAAA
jgi:hypothetical protein